MLIFRKFLLAALALATGPVLPQGEVDPIDTGELDASAAPPLVEEACFSPRDVRSFDGLSDRYVYVEGRGDNHYLLTMQTACFGLRSAFGIAISSRMNRVCSNSGATIAYRDSGRRESCRVRRVERVEDKAGAERIVRQRTAED